MPTATDEYRVLIARVEHMCHVLDRMGTDRHTALSAELLEVAARMDATLRHLEWGCPPDRVDRLETHRACMAHTCTALARITRLLAEQRPH